MIGIDYEVFRKNVNMTQRTTRDGVIAIAFALWLDFKEANEALHLYGMPSLDYVVEREEEIIGFLRVSD